MKTLFTAISIVQPHGNNIATRKKTIEVRSWVPEKLPLRDLVIVENRVFLSESVPEDPDGRAVAIVDVIEVHPWREDEVESACSSGWQPGYFAWVLENVRALPGTDVVPAKRKLYELELDTQICNRVYSIRNSITSDVTPTSTSTIESNTDADSPPGLLRIILTLPIFLLITLIPWLLAANAYALALRFSAADYEYLRILCQTVGIGIASITIITTLWFLVLWVVTIVRYLRGNYRIESR